MIDVDTLLGDHRMRYFGDGHKRTDYSIIFKENVHQFYGAISQSGLWSNKSDKIIQPHLSTLDGVILASLLAEKYLEEEKESPENFFLSKFMIKSGMKPIENLNQVPVALRKKDLNKNKAEFDISVLDMKIKLEFQRFTVFSKTIEKEKIDKKEYLPNHLKDIHHKIYDISFLETLDTADRCSIFCKANKVINKNYEYKGISSNFSKSYSLLELLIIFSQMAEMLAYHADDIDRECSETLWMKNVSAEISEPIPNGELGLLAKITKNKLLDMKGKRWKIFEMSGTDTQSRIKISGKIAHQLPESEVEVLSDVK
ncbi:AvrD family protein [Streptococcus dentapri]|uniref:AvrD family protein n=1 Tax=Streptococcus dentapri TaxID=573564 RepID=A0ABV8D1V0_9STRE